MSIEEKVFLPAFKHVHEIQMAADLFVRQYGSVHVYVRGNVSNMHSKIIHLADWYTVAVMNANLNIMGIGDMNKDEENFCWVSPTEQGEIQLTTLQEERNPQKA